jgi:hypothetical protein
MLRFIYEKQLSLNLSTFIFFSDRKNQNSNLKLPKKTIKSIKIFQNKIEKDPLSKSIQRLRPDQCLQIGRQRGCIWTHRLKRQLALLGRKLSISHLSDLTQRIISP